MACEVPVIATRIGGIPEVVRDGIDGFLYDVGDINSMANGCLSILNNPQVREQLGKAARDRATREFCASRLFCSMKTFTEKPSKKLIPTPKAVLPRCR